VTRIVRTDGNGRGGIPDLDSDIERDRLKKKYRLGLGSDTIWRVVKF
jgi:hypothetical protein